MKTYEELLENTSQLEEKLGYTFKDKSLLVLAFVHRSYINENKHVTQHNERLEFLGDSVLDLLTSEYLYTSLPEMSEGDLSHLRARLVEAQTCVQYIQKFTLENEVLLGKGERMNDGRGRDTILADLFEAIIGAIYIDGGLQAARDFYFQHFTPEISGIIKTPLSNWKALLQDFCQKNYQHTPTYQTLEETGPDHSKSFLIAVEVNGEVVGHGRGSSKKEAQQAAAEEALKKIHGS